MRSTATKILLAATLLAVVPATGASAAVLFDQTAGPGSSSTYSIDEPGLPTDSQAADDFTVPPGQQWTIAEVDVLGEGGAFPARVRIYSSAGNVPGSLLFEEDDAVTTNGNDFKAALARPPVLGPGTYWLSVSAPASWAWVNSRSDTGSPAVWQNPSGLLPLTPVPGCGTTWTSRSTCYPGSAAEPGQAFKLIGPPTNSGAKPSNDFTIGSFKQKKNGTATLGVSVPGPGRLVLSGKGLTTSQLNAPSAGLMPLFVQAVGKTARKLKKTGKAKVTASVSFTPTGGDPATRNKALTLKGKKKKKKKKKGRAASSK